MSTVFITGGTGYIGKRLIKRLVQRNHSVLALVRKGSEHKVPAGAQIITANPFDPKTFESFIPKNAVFVQLLGVPHPSPKKALAFKEIDLRSVKASADAAAYAEVSKFVYISVAMAATNVMKAYQQVRKEGESYCLLKGFPCTFIRPWYVLGPGHLWPILLLPLYAISMLFPSLREKARALALVTLNQVLTALITVIEQPLSSNRILEITDIRKAAVSFKKTKGLPRT